MRMQTLTEEKVATNEFYLEQCAEQNTSRDKGRKRKGKLQHEQKV